MIERAKAEELSDEQLDRELQKRLRDLLYRDQRQSFEKYCENSDLFPEESPAKHHAFMCGALQLVAAGEIKRLMVLMPPGHGKSVYCSVRFPSLVGVNYAGRLTSIILAGVAGSETNYLLSVTSSWVSVERLVRALLRR